MGGGGSADRGTFHARHCPQLRTGAAQRTELHLSRCSVHSGFLKGGRGGQEPGKSMLREMALRAGPRCTGSEGDLRQTASCSR